MENVEYFQAKKREVTLRFRIEKDVVDQLCQNQKMKSLNVSVRSWKYLFFKTTDRQDIWRSY